MKPPLVEWALDLLAIDKSLGKRTRPMRARILDDVMAPADPQHGKCRAVNHDTHWRIVADIGDRTQYQEFASVRHVALLAAPPPG
jgi:hypothetical protein